MSEIASERFYRRLGFATFCARRFVVVVVVLSEDFINVFILLSIIVMMDFECLFDLMLCVDFVDVFESSSVVVVVVVVDDDIFCGVLFF